MGKRRQGAVAMDEAIATKIHIIRDRKIILDRDLAELFNVTTDNLKKAVQRIPKRFARDECMFQLTPEEFDSLTSKIETVNAGGRRTAMRPFAFTEEGVVMLSSVLNSDIAIALNIQMIRSFVNVRSVALRNHDFLAEINPLEQTGGKKSDGIQMIFATLNELMKARVEANRKKKNVRKGDNLRL